MLSQNVGPAPGVAAPAALSLKSSQLRSSVSLVMRRWSLGAVPRNSVGQDGKCSGATPASRRRVLASLNRIARRHCSERPMVV